MSKIKDYLIDLLNQEKEEFIRNRLNDEDANEETDGWAELEDEYYSMKDAHFEDEYYEWIKAHPYHEIYENFMLGISELKHLLGEQKHFDQDPVIFKMIYAQTVTLLESFLGDTVKSLIISNDHLFQNAINRVDDLKNANFNLNEIITQKDGAHGLAIKVLSDVLFHNLPKVKKILESILNVRLNIDIGPATQIIRIRHDIVHRNGKTKDGEYIEINKSTANEAIREIEFFVKKLQEAISNISA